MMLVLKLSTKSERDSNSLRLLESKLKVNIGAQYKPLGSSHSQFDYNYKLIMYTVFLVDDYGTITSTHPPTNMIVGIL